jgi:hypothetical protein
MKFYKHFGNDRINKDIEFPDLNNDVQINSKD